MLHFFVFTVAGWINRGQQDIIEYLRDENRILREQLGGRRLRLTDDQRRRLAIRAKVLGGAALRGFSCIVTPDTLLGWYRKLVAAKYNGAVLPNNSTSRAHWPSIAPGRLVSETGRA